VLLDAGAPLDIWSAIAPGRAADVRGFVERDRGVLRARMSRNEHRRTPRHHAAALDRGDMVRLLIDLGADVAATDDTGATPLTAAALRAGDPTIVAMLERAGARLDLVAAVGLGRHDVAERMVAQEPGRLGPHGRDTIALHVLVAAQNTAAVQ
jgi:ketosteroid isomerase-like protein